MNSFQKYTVSCLAVGAIGLLLCMPFDAEAALDSCNSLQGGECTNLGSTKPCGAKKKDKCVTCQDANGDGRGHWSAPHACTSNSLVIDTILDGPPDGGI
jgi:hypothetical protein